MWADELDDPEYYDVPLNIVSLKNRPDFFSQPITTYTKNIINAITGVEYPYRIGSIHERRFYVVMENDPYNPRDARRLFFDTPQQYEQATGIKVSVESKARFLRNQVF